MVEPIITEDVLAPLAEVDLAGTATGTITGTITYPQRIAPPLDAAIIMTRQNINYTGALSEIIAAETLQTTDRQVSNPFPLSYDPTNIEEGDRYVGHAKIFYSNVNWTSTIVYPLITQNNSATDVDLWIEQIGSL